MLQNTANIVIVCIVDIVLTTEVMDTYVNVVSIILIALVQNDTEARQNF